VLERGPATTRAPRRPVVEPGTGEIVALRPTSRRRSAVVATRMRETEGPIRLVLRGAVDPAPGELGQREVLQAGSS